MVPREMESRTMGVEEFGLRADDHDSVKSSDAGEREKTPVPHWTAKQRSHRLPELRVHRKSNRDLQMTARID